VTVRADDRAADARSILIRHGAFDFERRGNGEVLIGTGLKASPY
jgi:hypothetical protein